MMTENRSIFPLRGEDGDCTRQAARSGIYRGGTYQIIIEGHLDGDWSKSLGGMQIVHDEGGNTLLRGVIPDQSALHGVLVQIRDLGLVLISLKRIDHA